MREGVFRAAGLTAAALLGLGFPAARAAAEPAAVDPASAIGGPSDCPRPDAVWSELVTLVPRERLDARLRAVAQAATPPVEIVDLGAAYRVLAAGQVREYRDESRDCAYRARLAAVFVALALDPAQLAAPPPPPVPPPPAPPPSPPPLAAPPQPGARLDLGATAQGGVGPSDRTGQLGLELRWGGGRGRFGPEAGLAALLPVDNTVGGVRLRQWRVPVDAGVRATGGGARFQPYGELGLQAALIHERALDLASPRSATAVEVGLRAGAGVHATHGRFAPFVALAAELVPLPPSVFSLPAGTVGHTPLFWIGATAGASLSFL